MASGGRDLRRASDALEPLVTGAAVQHYSTCIVFPLEASRAMFRVLSDTGSQLPGSLESYSCRVLIPIAGSACAVFR